MGRVNLKKMNIYFSFFCSDSIQDQIGCRLPWNKGNTSLQNCSTAEELKKFYTLAEHMMYSGENRYYQMTKCEQPCDYFFYRAKQVRISQFHMHLAIWVMVKDSGWYDCHFVS